MITITTLLLCVAAGALLLSGITWLLVDESNRKAQKAVDRANQAHNNIDRLWNQLELFDNELRLLAKHTDQKMNDIHVRISSSEARREIEGFLTVPDKEVA